MNSKKTFNQAEADRQIRSARTNTLVTLGAIAVAAGVGQAIFKTKWSKKDATMLALPLARVVLERLMMRRMGGKPVPAANFPKVTEAFASVSAKMNVKAELVVRETTLPNAAATGFLSKPQVHVFSGLAEILDQRELEAVLAHELGHVKNYDTWLPSVGAALLGVLGKTTVAPLITRIHRKNAAAGQVAQVGTALASNALMIYMMRVREKAADAESARGTQDPLALVSALNKLVSSRKGDKGKQSIYGYIMSRLPWWLQTHPTADRRAANLGAMLEGGSKQK